MEEVYVEASVTARRAAKLPLIGVFSSRDLIDITGSALVNVVAAWASSAHQRGDINLLACLGMGHVVVPCLWEQHECGSSSLPLLYVFTLIFVKINIEFSYTFYSNIASSLVFSWVFASFNNNKIVYNFHKI